MNVYDFCGLCTEPRMTNVAIYDLNPNCQEPGSIVFKGVMYDASLSKYRDCEVCNFDLTDEGMTVNIDTSLMRHLKQKEQDNSRNKTL